MEKKREHRYQSARDLMADLSERRLMPASPTTIGDFIVRPQWVIAFGVIGLIVWMATIALILWQRPWRAARNESNRAVPTSHSVAGDTSQPPPRAPAADTTNRSKETEAISVKGSKDAGITNRTDSTTGSPPLAKVGVASTTLEQNLKQGCCSQRDRREDSHHRRHPIHSGGNRAGARRQYLPLRCR